MNTLLLLAGGGVAAYFLFVRERIAAAATLPSAPPPRFPPGTHVPAAPAPRPTQVAPIPPRAPVTPAQITASASRPASAGPVSSSDGAVGPRSLRPLGGKWVWPVPRWEGRAPVISDGFGSVRPSGASHAGVDIMFARIASDPFPVGSPNGSKNFVMPSGWMALSASDGVLWSAGHTPRGFAVVVDHGEVATFYTHLDTLFVPQLKPPTKGTKPDHVIPIKAGQPLGVIGGDPTVYPHLKHLHFELWLGGPADAVDPKPLMGSWQVFTPSDLAPFFPSLARNARRKDGPRPDLVSVAAHHRAWPGERQR